MPKMSETVKVEVVNAAMLLILFMLTITIVVGSILITELLLGSLLVSIGVVFGAAAIFIIVFKSLIFEEEVNYGETVDE